MKERPILFSGPMVRAILEGRKTQTRRVIKHFGNSYHYDILLCDWGLSKAPKHVDDVHWEWELQTEVDASNSFKFKCPYGTIGDRLWVRETFCPDYYADGKVGYRADWANPTPEVVAETKWKPSIHMPKWASRITLEITGVRVERLQDISGSDIVAEGAVLRPHDNEFGHNPVSAFDGKIYMDLKSLWAAGWQSINGPVSWDANPWVWVLEFKRI